MKSVLMAAILLVAPAAMAATAAPAVDPSPRAAADPGLEALNGSDWVVKQEDNVSGVSNAHQITNPAKISYDSLMKDTSEMKELRRKGIKKESARGQVLVSAAKDRVRRAAKAVMTTKGHCSVWKKIRSKTGKTVPDITESVRKKLNG